MLDTRPILVELSASEQRFDSRLEGRDLVAELLDERLAAVAREGE